MDLRGWFDAAVPDLTDRLSHAPAVAQAMRWDSHAAAAVHLAVLVEPFLAFVLDGSKTIESRFASTRVAPFRAVADGDVLLLKAASGPVVGAALVESALYFHPLSDRTRRDLHQRFGAAMRDDVAGFWEERKAAKYATLIELNSVAALRAPLPCPKTDRRGWVVVRERSLQLRLFGT